MGRSLDIPCRCIDASDIARSISGGSLMDVVGGDRDAPLIQ